MVLPRRRLFGFRYEVQPSPGHPQYFEKEAGRLILWILATEEEEAFTNAFMILELLPYTLVSEDITLLVPETSGADPADLLEAWTCGLKLIWLPVGFEADQWLNRGRSAG